MAFAIPSSAGWQVVVLVSGCEPPGEPVEAGAELLSPGSDRGRPPAHESSAR
jgi:hypothetical protein